MQLNSVVLPAPFGPMRPTISPASMLNDTSRLASRPPNRLVEDSRLSSEAIALRRRRTSQSQPAAPGQGEQPGRTERRDDDDDEPVDDQVDAAAGERSGAQRRAHDLRDR